jgi:aminoglycoside phosphotransferase (APT) family kinase protein
MILGEQLGSGRTSEVYAVDDERVLRRVRAGIDIDHEAAALCYVVAQGYPAPRLYELRGQDMLMQRLYGPTMLTAVVTGQMQICSAGAVLADLLRALHRLPPRPGADSQTRLLHLDLHPDNVILTPSGPVVIDWTNARDGTPTLDVALSALIIAQVAADAEHEAAQLARSLLAAFLDHGLELLDQLPAAATIRGTNPTMTPRELFLIPDAVALIHSLAA